MKASTQCLAVCFSLSMLSLVFDASAFVILATITFPAYFICRAIEGKQ